MDWKNSSENAYPDIILHDCFVSKINVLGDDIIIDFSTLGFFKIDKKLNNFLEQTVEWLY
ncbi:hypothetical protein G7062_08035 [Erysipelothrix sp. HDW6C]|uniref:hypothetical protein n=1 Tax=Erysipelothrix sp. HDW6C TaxID=2714930 RepID=UPI001408B5C6|nr:hypothetical protein [Erysipelothrix sp. HDW6C]QIK70242.1 hypothetical protein G7062_08035 [Erysipelothrix sp. HDW6C]